MKELSIKTVESMVAWVEVNMEENPTLDKMSDFVGYSSFYCSAKFHEVVGVSFKEYVIKRKLELAAIELRNINCRIIDIAVKYGFSSNEAFTRAFSKRYGCSPRHYRKEQSQLPMFEKSAAITV